MAIQTQTFKKRVRAHSGLSPQARLVALVLADLRYEAKLHAHEPLPLKLADLARECGMARSVVAQHLADCVAAGWIVAKQVHRDGHQQPSEYTLADPTGTDAKPANRRRKPMTEADKARLTARAASGPPDSETGKAASDGTNKSVGGPDTVVRSNNSPATSRPPAVASSPDEQDVHTSPRTEPESPAAGPAVAGATPAAEPVSNEPSPERIAAQRELWDQIARARQGRRQRWTSWRDERTPEQRQQAAALTALLTDTGTEQRDDEHLADQAAKQPARGLVGAS